MMKRYLACAVFIALSLPTADAQALSRSQVRETITASQKIIDQHLGPDSCTGRTPKPLLLTQAALVASRALERTKVGAMAERNDTTIADARPATCELRFAWDAMESRAYTCARVWHERVHLHGRRFANNPDDPAHSLNPNSVMFATATAIPRPCMIAFPPALVRERRAHGWRCRPQSTDSTWTCKRRHSGLFDTKVV